MASILADGSCRTCPASCPRIVRRGAWRIRATRFTSPSERSSSTPTPRCVSTATLASEAYPIDWEKNFGDGDVNRFRFDGFWRFADRHKLRALVFSSSRSASRTFDDDIEWGGETFQANATIEGEIKFSIYELAYEYAFMRRENYEVAASLGLHYARLRCNAGRGTRQRRVLAGPRRRIKKSGSVGAPLPVFGLRGTWLLSQTFSIDVSGQYFSLNYGDFDGNIQDYRALVNWQPKSWLGHWRRLRSLRR